MKKLFLVAILFQLLQIAKAQVETESNENFEILDNFEIATGKNVDSKSLFKLTRNGNINNNLEISYEQKLNRNFSIVGSIRGNRYYTFVQDDPIELNDTFPLPTIPVQAGTFKQVFRFSGTLEGRYYIHQNDFAANGAGNNVNGLYALAGIGSTFYDGVENNSLPVFTYIGVGVQSRILKYGIIDFSLLATYRDERYTLSPNVRAGFAFSKNYKTLEFDNARCNILKCFEERNYQFKIPFNSALFFGLRPDWNHGYISVNPRIDFEHRLVKGLSFNHRFSYSNLWNINFGDEINIRPSGSGFGYTNNLRWYILKKRNIASGKSADNLSGFYAETHLQIHRQRHLIFDPNNINNRIIAQKSSIKTYGVNVGYQTRLFKRLYVDAYAFLLSSKRDITFTNPDLQVGSTGTNSWTRYGINLDFGYLF